MSCRRHGVVVCAVPWARHRSRLTRSFEDQTAWLAVNTSKSAVAQLMRIAWRTVGQICERVAAEAQREVDLLAGLERIGIDEISHRKGQRYLTVVVDHDSGRLVWAGAGRDRKTVEAFFDQLGEKRCKQIKLGKRSVGRGDITSGGECGAVEREEAEAIYDQGREAVVAVLMRMDDQIQRLSERVARQDEKIARLERRLGQDSSNSSEPPSQDAPGRAPRRGKGPSGRAPGGQPGHEGRGRGLLPIEAVDEVVEHWPDRCGCGHVFCAEEHVAAGDAVRRQIEELPVMAVCVIEHRASGWTVRRAGRAGPRYCPTRLPTAPSGPACRRRTLSVRNRISRRDVVELCEQLFSARMSTGSVEAILQRCGDALAEPYEDLLEEIRLAPAVNMDETGWRLRGRQRALWARSLTATPCCASPPIATRIMPGRCWAPRRRS